MRLHLFLIFCLFLCSTLFADEPGSAPLRRIAFGSCARQDKPQPIWDAVLDQKPEIFLFLGDNIYGDTNDMTVLKRKYEQLGKVPGFQRLKQSVKLMATWDDHDYGKDDAGYEYGPKKESQNLFLDFFGIPADSPRRQQDGIYSAEAFGPPGQRVQIIMLDTRTFRTPLKKQPVKNKDEGPYIPDSSETADMLGATQWKWLEEQLKQTADVRIIASSIQVVAEDHGWEKWSNFPTQREKLFKLIETSKAKGVIFVSGDRHLAEISMQPTGMGYPAYDVTSSGLTEANKRWRTFETNRHRVGTMNFGNNFGLITFDWYQKDPLIRLQIRDELGEVTLQQKVSLSTIHPGWAPKFPSTVAAAPQATSPGTINTLEAAKKIGEEVTVEFTVKATGGSGSRVFLNSVADFRDSSNFTVVLEKDYLKAATEITEPREYFKGKKIQVTGKVDTYRDTVQIKVSDPKQMKVVP